MATVPPQPIERPKPAPATGRLEHIWQRLTEPADAVQELGERRRARLLSSILFALVVLTPMSVISPLVFGPANETPSANSLVMGGVVLVLAIAYGVSRTRHYKLAAALTVGIVSLAPFATLFSSGDYSPNSLLIRFIWSVMALLLGSVYLSMQDIALLALANVAGLLLLPTIIPELVFSAVVAPAGFIVCVSALILVAGYHREQVERERLARLLKRQRELEALRQTLEIRTREMEASQRITFAVSERVSPDELLSMVVNLIRDQFQLYHAQVYVVDEERDAAVLRQSTGYAGRQLLQKRHEIPLTRNALVVRAIRSGEPVMVVDVNKESGFLPNPLLPYTRSELVIPLKVGGRVIGVLDVQDRTPGRFTESTLILFQTMTDQIAFLFENSRLLERVTNQTETLALLTNQLRTAADIAARLGAILDPELLLQKAVALFQSRFGIYHTHVYLLKGPAPSPSEAESVEERSLLVLQAGSGEVGRVLRERGHSIPLDREQSLVARAARTQDTVLVGDTNEVEGYIPNPLLPQIRSELAVPLIAGEELLGVLDLQDDHPHRFGQTDVDTLNTLAGQIASALQSAKLYQEVQRSAEQLREADLYKSEFLSSLNYELRTPLNSIMGYAELLLMGVKGKVTPEIAKDLQAIYDNSQYVIRIITDVLNLTEMKASRLQLNFREVQIKALIEEIGESAAKALDGKPVELVVEIGQDLPRIQGDYMRLWQILDDLISNAIKFTDKGSITLRAFRDDDWVCIEIQDTGTCITEADSEKANLELATTRHLVQLHDGTVDLYSQPGHGNTFTICLPVQRKGSEAPVDL